MFDPLILQPTQSAKMDVFLRKVNNNHHHSSELRLRNWLLVAAAKHNGWLVDSSQWFPKCGWKPNNSGEGSKK